MIQCVNWAIDDIKDVIGSGVYIDPSNNDLTCNNLSRYSGYEQAMSEVRALNKLFTRYSMLEVADAKDHA